MRARVINDIVNAYAAKWDVPCEHVRVKRTHRAFFIFVEFYEVDFESAEGRGVAFVGVNGNVRRFEYSPNDPKRFLVPLWAAYPEFSSVSSGWRQGYGEPYKYKWHGWYRSLTHAERARYKERFPPPADTDRCWTGFYEFIADVPASDPNSIAEFIIGRV